MTHPSPLSAAILSGAVLAVAVIGCAGINSYLPGGGDNAGYIAEAESWLETGQRRRLYEAGTPPATLKPPLFPMLLAGVERLCGRNLAAMKAVLVLCAIAAVLAAWWALRCGLEEGEPPSPLAPRPSPLAPNPSPLAPNPSSLITLWFALAPSLTLYTHDILSDVPFTAAVLAAIGLAARAGSPKARWWQPILLGAVLVLCQFLRAAGVIVAGACTAYMLVRAWSARREAGSRRTGWCAAGLCVLTLAMLYYMQHDQQSYLSAQHLGRKLPAAAEASGGLAKRLKHSAKYYAVFLPAEVAIYEGFGSKEAYIVAALGCLVCAVGLIELLRRRKFLIPVIWLVYQAGLLFWPFLEPRFYLPTLPLFLCLLWVGGEKILAWAGSAGKACSFAVAFVLALAPAASICGTRMLAGAEEVVTITFVEYITGAVILAGVLAWASLRTGGEPGSAGVSPALGGLAEREDEGRRDAGAPTARRLAAVVMATVLLLGATRCVCENVIRERQRGPVPADAGWQEFYAAALWLKQHAAPDEVVLSAKMPLVWFWSGLRGVGVPKGNDARKAQQALSAANWFIVDSLPEDGAAADFAETFLPGQTERWEVPWRQGGTAVLKRKQLHAATDEQR
ncbi:MAG: hypothetical protein ABSE73_15820 [Planctomycetota bacterium]